MRPRFTQMTFGGGIAALAVAALVAGFQPAKAEVLQYTLQLSPKNEVPPNASGGSGTANITFDTATKQLTWKVTYSGLTGDATMAHFHGPADTSKNAPVVLPFKTFASPFEGSATLTDAQAADFLAGHWYINIHTAANPTGELRAQVTK